jgi:hypothetical protein
MAKAKKARMTDEAARDLDETRRLLYMALLVPRTRHWELAATIVNAVKHHQQVDIPTSELIDRVTGYIESNGKKNGKWVRGQIQRCIDELGG